jgi:3-oxoadipate enol-lactonase
VSADLACTIWVDDFTEPRGEPETILLLHGNAESSLAWYAWIPTLARRYRVLRPDMRGYGASTERRVHNALR